MKTGFLLLFVCLATCLLVESKKYGGHQGKHDKQGKKYLVDKHDSQKQYKEKTPKLETLEKKGRTEKYENRANVQEKENSDLNDRTIENSGSKKDKFQKSKSGKYENHADVPEKQNSNSNDASIETSGSKKEKFIQENENSVLNDGTIENSGSKKDKFQKSKSGKYETRTDVPEKQNSNSNDVPIQTSGSKKEKFIQKNGNYDLNEETIIKNGGSKKDKFQKGKSEKYKNRVDVQEEQNSNSNDAPIEASGSKKEKFQKGFKNDKFTKESKNTKVRSTEGAYFKKSYTNDKNTDIRQKETRKPQKEQVEKIPEPLSTERKKRDTEQVSQVQDRTLRENNVPSVAEEAEKRQQINEIEAGCLKRDNIYAPRPERLQNETNIYKRSECCACQDPALEMTYEDADSTLNNISGSCLVESNSAVAGVN